MQKELIISTTPQETKLAILEDDELVEYYIERHRSQGIVGNIYKGKVTKVLPGMQSAFVDIGLERDAFLYVSDFFEDTEEYDKIVSTVEDEVAQLQEGGRKPAAPAMPPPIPAPLPVAAPTLTPPPIPVAPVVAAEDVPEPPVVAAIQPLPGEVLTEVERHQAAAPQLGSGISGMSDAPPPVPRPPRTDYDDRAGGRGRGPRDRDRRGGGKKPKIPSFENKSYEMPRPDE